MKKIFAVGPVLALLLTAQVSQADFIVAVGAGANTTKVGFAPAATDFAQLTSRDFTSPAPIVPVSGFPVGSQVSNDNYSGSGAANPNQVILNLNVFALNSPFDVNVTSQPATSLPPPGDPNAPAEYFFTVNVTNMLNANGVDPGNAGKEINNFRVQLVKLSGPLTGADLDDTLDPFPVATGGSAFPLGFATVVSSTNLLYEGGGIGFGQTATINFSLDLPAGSNIDPPSVFALRFTANPEPGTMALAGLALGAGGWFVRRRRKNEAVKA